MNGVWIRLPNSVVRWRRWLMMAGAATMFLLFWCGPEVGVASADATVSNWSDLQAAFAAGGTVTLGADITADPSEALTVGSTPVVLDLSGHNLTAVAAYVGGHATIQVDSGSDLTIEDTSVGVPGTLNVRGSVNGAAIGSGLDKAVGNITIKSGKVVANGFKGGAAIGGGGNPDGVAEDPAGTLTVTGGTVIVNNDVISCQFFDAVNGACWGAGIGGGQYQDGGTIKLLGGTIQAQGPEYAPAIGSGYGATGAGSDITVDGATVIANGGRFAAGVGGGLGNTGDVGKVTVNSGSLTATGGEQGAGIGGGSYTAGGLLTVNGGSVIATGGVGSAGIGGGVGAMGGVVSVAPGGTVSATAGTPVLPDDAPPQAVGGGEGTADQAGYFGVFSNNGSLTMDSEAVPADGLITNGGTITTTGTLAGSGGVTNNGTLKTSGSGVIDTSGGLAITVHNFTLNLQRADGTPVTTVLVYSGSVASAGKLLPLPPVPPVGSPQPAYAGWFTPDGEQVSATTDLQSVLGNGPVSVILKPRFAQTISFSPPASPASAGTQATLPATSDSGLAVSLTVDSSSTPSGVCTVTGTTVTFVRAGTCVIDANQPGGGDFAPAAQVQRTVTVESVASTVELADPPATVYGQPAMITATVSEADDSDPSGEVQFAVDGSDVGSPVTVVNGNAESPDLNAGMLAPGAHQVSARFSPDGPAYDPASADPVTLTVDQAATTTAVSVGESSIDAAVAPVAPGNGDPTGTVTFRVGGEEVGEAELTDGTATLDYTVPTGGSREVAVVYSGDANFTGSSGSTTRNDPTITARLTSNQPKSSFGWYRTPVSIEFTCVANGAPLSGPCPGPVTLSGDGAGQSVTRSITATDGGAAIATVAGINLDRTRPKVRIGGVKRGATYKGKAPAARCVGSDAVSGIASCKITRRRTTRRTGLLATRVRYRLKATDKAGNAATTKGAYRILGIYLKGTHFRNGVFRVREGRTYRLVVTRTARRPRYVYASPSPHRPKVGGQWFRKTGDRNWTTKVRFTRSMRLSGNWNLGVRIGRKLHLVRVRVK